MGSNCERELGMINSYPSIYNLGHAAIADLLKGRVIVEEKVDGSQFSFGRGEDGEVSCRSKGAEINMLAPEGMFAAGVRTVQALEPLLTPGVTYRGEYLSKPHHNALTYDRVPKGNIIIFDVNSGLETYEAAEQKRMLAALLGLECVPVLFEGMIENVKQLRDLLETQSVLGGQKIEGVVIKPAHYDLFGRDKKTLMGKFVSEAFREVHSKTWETEHKNKTGQDILQLLASKYGTAGRWGKALIHLRESGKMTNSPKDIGELMKEVPDDVMKECAEEIQKDLMAWAWPQLRRGIVKGLPEWYKSELLNKQFEA